MTTIKLSAMQIREQSTGRGVMAIVDKEWRGVSRVGEDELLTELPTPGDLVEVGAETMRVTADL